MAKYKKVQLNYDAIQYTGDIDALLEFGVPKVDYQQYKTKHVAIPTEKGEALCAVDDYITKDQFGNFEVVPRLKFEQEYSDKLL